MLHGVGGDADFSLRIVGQHSVAAVGIAGTAREVAADDIHLQAMARRKGGADVAKGNDDLIDLPRLQPLRPCLGWVGNTGALHRAGNAIH
jgi:hypothetical protein